MLQINTNIKLIRELSGKSQKVFAQLIKTNLSNLKTYENTDVRPKANVIAAIADFAGISMEDLENKKLTHKDIKIESRKDKKDDNTYEIKSNDLSKDIGKILAWQAGVDATLSVLISEITPLIASQTGKSNAAVFSQMKKDIEDETSKQIALLNKK